MIHMIKSSKREPFIKKCEHFILLSINTSTTTNTTTTALPPPTTRPIYKLEQRENNKTITNKNIHKGHQNKQIIYAS